MKLIGTFNLGGGISIEVSAEPGKVELHTKILTTTLNRTTVTVDKAEKLNVLLDWAIVEAKKP